MLKNTEVHSSKRMRTNVESFTVTPHKKLKSIQLKNGKVHEIVNDNDHIMKPHMHDVLCGRGHVSHNHDGNSYFRRLVKSYKNDYISSSKKQKKVFSIIIYEKIRKLDPPGRFLKFDATESKWRDIGKKKAIEKVRQALREGAPEIINTLQEKKSVAESILLLKGQDCYDTEESVEGDTDSQQSSSTISDMSIGSIDKINEIDSMHSSTKYSSPLIEGYKINTLESLAISRKKTDHECIIMPILWSNCMFSKMDKHNFKIDALPGPRIIPTRYF